MVINPCGFIDDLNSGWNGFLSAHLILCECGVNVIGCVRTNPLLGYLCGHPTPLSGHDNTEYRCALVVEPHNVLAVLMYVQPKRHCKECEQPLPMHCLLVDLWLWLRLFAFQHILTQTHVHTQYSKCA